MIKTSSEVETRLRDPLQGKKLQDLKNHVVQIESMILGLALFVTIISLAQGTFLAQLSFSFLIPFVLLAFVPTLVRVTNPPSTLRARLSWGLSGAGVGATIGGGITGVLTGGLATPAGALIGAPIGFIVGMIAGPSIDGGPTVMTQGEAREYMVNKLKHYPGLTIEKIVEATEYDESSPNLLGIYMFQSDGIIKCTKKSVQEWLEVGSWMIMP